jgi:NAD(P)H-hydrate epimerase
MKFKKVLSIKDIKKLEIQEFKRRGNSFSLMKSAGTAAAKIILKLIKKQPIIVVCGPGNNGGDGFILAEYLRKKSYKVDVFRLQKKHYKDDALKALSQLQIKSKNILDLKIKKKSVIIDCLFGTGISRNVSGFLRKVILKINKSKQKTISIDIPSGIHGDTGKVYGYAIRANVTLALHSKKTGHTLYPGRNYCGKIIVVDIGMSKKFNNYIG